LDDLRNSKSVAPVITAIVPTYNRARYLATAIDSVLNQTLRPAEVLVVDDGSVDETREILKAYGTRIEAIHKTNGGKASALNLALKHARGEFIWIFDDDDVALPDALEKMFDALAEHPERAFAYGLHDHLVESDSGQFRVAQPDLRIDKSLDFRLSVLERCYIFQPAMLVRRAVFDSVGPFNEALVRSQDYEMLMRITRRFSGVDVGSTLFHQRQHAGPRGSVASPVAKGKVASAWIRYDDMIFSHVYATYPLSEYLADRNKGELSPAEKRSAVLQRACIMARKGLWSHGAADLKTFSALRSGAELTLSESTTLRRFFGPYSYADHKLSESGVFFCALRNSFPARVRWKIAANLLAPILGELRYSIRKGHVRYFLGTARKCLVFSSMYLRAGHWRDEPIGAITGMES
jgi:glycosyltransferase involved in cell wall biosynthesis